MFVSVRPCDGDSFSLDRGVQVPVGSHESTQRADVCNHYPMCFQKNSLFKNSVMILFVYCCLIYVNTNT